MTWEEEMERRANQYVTSEEEFPYCLTCGDFIYLDEMDRCLRCRGRNVVWRPMPAPSDKRFRERKWDLVYAALVCMALGGLALWALFR